MADMPNVINCALKGLKNVLSSVEKSKTIKTFVFTSSSAVLGMLSDPLP